MLRSDSVWVFPALLNWRDVGWSARHLSYWSYGTHINPQNVWNFVFLLTWALSDSCTDLSSVVKWSNSEIPGLRHVVSLWLCFIIVNLLRTIIKTQHVDWPSRSWKDTIFVIKKLGKYLWPKTLKSWHYCCDLTWLDPLSVLFIFSPSDSELNLHRKDFSCTWKATPPPPLRGQSRVISIQLRVAFISHD